jgi:hypothetical protein
MSTTRTTCVSFICLVVCASLSAQNNTAQSPTQQESSAQTSGANTGAVLDILVKIEQEAQNANVDLARLRVEKWKTDSQQKQQSQASVDSIARNLSAALPGMTSAVRKAPSDFTGNFKLYRDLVALNDAFKNLTESAGAFGPKQDYEALSQHAAAFDSYRSTMADYIESLAAQKDAEVARLRSTVRQAAPTLPKKIIVDDNAPAPAKKKSTTKKKSQTQSPSSQPR